MQMSVRGEAFDRAHVGAVGLDGEHGARLHGPAVGQHRARAADAGLAADVRPGEVAHVAQVVHEKHARID